MNNLYSICGMRENPSFRRNPILIGGYLIKENLRNEKSKLLGNRILGSIVDREESANIIGSWEKDKIWFKANYLRPLPEFKLEAEFDKEKKLWIGKYLSKSDQGTVELKIAPLKKEVDFKYYFEQTFLQKQSRLFDI